MLVFLIFLSVEANKMKQDIKKNIYEYEEVDLSHICQLFECIYIQNNNILYTNIGPNKYAKLVKSVPINNKMLALGDGVYILSNMNMLVEVIVPNAFNGFLVCSEKSIYEIIFNPYYQLFSLILFLNFIFLYYNIIQNNKINIKEKGLIESKMHLKTIVALTENIHHELNTPLMVVNNKLSRLQSRILDIRSGELNRDSCPIDDSIMDFKMASGAITQIRDILDRMKVFKYNKHEDSTRALDSVIYTTVDFMTALCSEQFGINIDENMSKYKTDTKYIKNGVLTGIILNHFKNSVEANATNINIVFNKFEKNNCSFYIADNGNGIDKNIQHKIFKENESTKETESRGNGLYINKLLLEESEGYVKLIESSNNGTIFEISIRCIKV
jgi:signal transduction histidine kinase